MVDYIPYDRSRVYYISGGFGLFLGPYQRYAPVFVIPTLDFRRVDNSQYIPLI